MALSSTGRTSDRVGWETVHLCIHCREVYRKSRPDLPHGGPLFYNNLDEMYTLVLSAATDPKILEESEILLTKRILAAVLAIREPLCLSGLAVPLNILSRLHAMISIPQDNDRV